MPRAGQNAANVNTVYSAEIEWDDFDSALKAMPPSLRHFLMYEASASYNPVEILQVKHSTFMSWRDIEEWVRAESRKGHRSDFGGVHPQLDTPRRAW